MNQRESTAKWFEELRNQICKSYEEIEIDFAKEHNLVAGKFIKKPWERDGGGGGVMSIMRGNVFEKVGVNISTVHGIFSEEFRKQIPGAAENPEFFATCSTYAFTSCSCGTF